LLRVRENFYSVHVSWIHQQQYQQHQQATVFHDDSVITKTQHLYKETMVWTIIDICEYKCDFMYCKLMLFCWWKTR